MNFLTVSLPVLFRSAFTVPREWPDRPDGMLVILLLLTSLFAWPDSVIFALMLTFDYTVYGYFAFLFISCSSTIIQPHKAAWKVALCRFLCYFQPLGVELPTAITIWLSLQFPALWLILFPLLHFITCCRNFWYQTVFTVNNLLSFQLALRCAIQSFLSGATHVLWMSTEMAPHLARRNFDLARSWDTCLSKNHCR